MNKRNITATVILFCTLAFLNSCGLVQDAAVGVGSINWPERYRGKLYDPDFYRTATEDDVRTLIAERSLVNESTTYTTKSFARNHGTFGLNDLFSPVIPNSYVAKNVVTVRPVDVAREFSPNKKVIRTIETASGISAEESMCYRLLADRKNSAVAILDEYKETSFSCAAASILITWEKTPELAVYLERHPEAIMDCTPEAVYLRNGYFQKANTPLVAAMNKNDLTALDLLIKQGVSLSSWQYMKDAYAPFPQQEFIKLLLKKDKGRIPQNTCDTLAQSITFSPNERQQIFLDYICDRCTFNALTEKALLENAIRDNQPALMKKMLSRGVTPEKDKEYRIISTTGESTDEVEKLLERHWAKVTR